MNTWREAACDSVNLPDMKTEGPVACETTAEAAWFTESERPTSEVSLRNCHVLRSDLAYHIKSSVNSV